MQLPNGLQIAMSSKEHAMRLTRTILVTLLLSAIGSAADATGAYVCRLGPNAPPPAPFARCNIEATSNDQSKPCDFKSNKGMTVSCMAIAESESDMLICVAGSRPNTESDLRAIASAAAKKLPFAEGINALAYTSGKNVNLNLSFSETPGGPSDFVECDPR
jgi:hypothetical protein